MCFNSAFEVGSNARVEPAVFTFYDIDVPGHGEERFVFLGPRLAYSEIMGKVFRSS